jgi:hypothetical protein
VLERLVIAPTGPARPLGRAVVAEVAAEFPTVTIVTAGPAAADERCVTVDLAAWAAPFADTGALDRRVASAEAQGPFGLRVVGGAPQGCVELLTRYQRFVARRNRASKGALFDRILARHRALHDLAPAPARTDLDHALDAWQWLLRLDPDAGLAVQAAALFRDVERLESETRARFEHRTSSPDSFLDGRARRGAAIARAILAGAGVSASVLDRVAALVDTIERPGVDAERALLDEAAALSFLSHDCAGVVDAAGPVQGRLEIARALRRLGARGRSRLRSIRYRPDVRALVLLALGGEAAQPVA